MKNEPMFHPNPILGTFYFYHDVLE